MAVVIEPGKHGTTELPPRSQNVFNLENVNPVQAQTC